MRADYEVSETFEPKQKKQKLGGPFIILSDGYFSGISFLNTTGQVFQATMGTNHDMKGWVELLLDAKILSLDEEILSINPEAVKLEFYWVVPKHQSGWETTKEKLPVNDDTPNKFLKQKDIIIDKAIVKHVHQFVLFIEKEQPFHSEFWSNFVPMCGGGEYCLLMQPC
jgi:hypothetical protein